MKRVRSHVGEEATGDVPHDPVHSLEQSLARTGTAADCAPVAGVHSLQLQEVSDLLGSEAAGDVLLVAEHQQRGAHQFLLPEQGVQFVLGVLEAEFVGAVDHPDDPVGLFEVVAPVGADGLLPAHVPDVELVVVVVEGLDVEPEGGRDLVDVLPVELLDDGGLACVVEAQHQQPHFLLLLLGLLDDRHEPHPSDYYRIQIKPSTQIAPCDASELFFI